MPEMNKNDQRPEEREHLVWCPARTVNPAQFPRKEAELCTCGYVVARKKAEDTRAVERAANDLREALLRREAEGGQKGGPEACSSCGCPWGSGPNSCPGCGGKLLDGTDIPPDANIPPHVREEAETLKADAIEKEMERREDEAEPPGVEPPKETLEEARDRMEARVRKLKEAGDDAAREVGKEFARIAAQAIERSKEKAGEPLRCHKHRDRIAVTAAEAKARGVNLGGSPPLCESCLNMACELMRAQLMDERRAKLEETLATKCGRRYVEAAEGIAVDRGTEFMEALHLLRESPASALFTGDTGTGKTWAAVYLYASWFLEGFDVSFYVAGDLLDELRGHAKAYGVMANQVASLRERRILIIDDLGADRITDVVAEGFRRVLDWRSRDGSPTIVTTNLEEAPLREHVGDAVVSRVLGLAGDRVLVFEGRDRREDPDG